MIETSDQTLRLLAQADELPVETDAPADGGPDYDAALLAELEQHGPDALAEFGMITVRDVAAAPRYNAAVWYALAHDLVYENRGDAVVITDPKGEKQ